MLNKPPLNQLMESVDSKYTLVIVAAKRARMMINDNPDMLSLGMINPVSVALNEVAEGNILWKIEEGAE
ncbi:MAG: DNA-directed RNA polymerase subunit omega [Clostridiales bacterium]